MNWFSGQKNLGENPNSAMDNELRQANSYALEMGVFVAVFFITIEHIKSYIVS